MPESTEDRQFTVEWLNRGNILAPSTFVARYSQQNHLNGWYEFKDADNKVVFAANADEIRCISSQPVPVLKMRIDDAAGFAEVAKTAADRRGVRRHA